MNAVTDSSSKGSGSTLSAFESSDDDLLRLVVEAIGVGQPGVEQFSPDSSMDLHAVVPERIKLFPNAIESKYWHSVDLAGVPLSGNRVREGAKNLVSHVPESLQIPVDASGPRRNDGIQQAASHQKHA